MIALLQRVTQASVDIAGSTVAAIGPGLLVLACAEPGDGDKAAKRLAEKVCGYRIFADAGGRMNLSVTQAGGALLVVPQFTLAADTRKGLRPGFSGGADPASGEVQFGRFVEHCSAIVSEVRTGSFGSDMQVSLTNDGPATFWLQVSDTAARRGPQGA